MHDNDKQALQKNPHLGTLLLRTGYACMQVRFTDKQQLCSISTKCVIFDTGSSKVWSSKK